MKPGPVAAETITIAITVYDRDQFLAGAIQSALAQRNGAASPSVMVVEDCGPNPQLREQTIATFGSELSYFRNERSRGLFDNWNACLEHCQTEWLCILHDDDFLEPNYVAAMVELATAAPARGLYYGRCHVVDREGNRVAEGGGAAEFKWHEPDIEEFAVFDPVCFPTQLFHAASARALGGFRPSSQYCADWEMWFKLAMAHGAAATNRVVANYREHYALGRGTTKVDVSGRKYALVNMQRKRHISWLRAVRLGLFFDRLTLLRQDPIPTRYLLSHSLTASPRMRRYNTGLLMLSGAPHLVYRFIRSIVRIFGWRSLAPLSRLYRALNRAS